MRGRGSETSSANLPPPQLRLANLNTKPSPMGRGCVVQFSQHKDVSFHDVNCKKHSCKRGGGQEETRSKPHQALFVVGFLELSVVLGGTLRRSYRSGTLGLRVEECKMVPHLLLGHTALVNRCTSNVSSCRKCGSALDEQGTHLFPGHSSQLWLCTRKGPIYACHPIELRCREIPRSPLKAV